MRKYNCRKLHAHTNIHTIWFRWNLQIIANLLHPFASASSNRYDAILTCIGCILADNRVAARRFCDNRIHWCIEEKLHLILQIRIQISKHDIVDSRPQMTYRCIKQMQIILNAYRLEPCTRRRIELRALATITHIDLINIFHQFERLFLANILIKRTAKIICNIIFSIRKCACTTKPAHDWAALTADTVFHLISINRAMPFVQCMSCFKHSNL